MGPVIGHWLALESVSQPIVFKTDRSSFSNFPFLLFSKKKKEMKGKRKKKKMLQNLLKEIHFLLVFPFLFFWKENMKGK
jgi:hypothetical protein